MKAQTLLFLCGGIFNNSSKWINTNVLTKTLRLYNAVNDLTSLAEIIATLLINIFIL